MEIAYTKKDGLFIVRTKRGRFTSHDKAQAFRMAKAAERRAQTRRVA